MTPQAPWSNSTLGAIPMTLTIRMLLIVCLFAVSTSLYAQLSTLDQVGLYTGKGTVVINMELDTPKPPKQAASYAVVINPDGSMDMQIVLEGGSLASGIGEGGFGASGAIYRVEIDALI